MAINVLYIFDYEKIGFSSALRRLASSINSLKGQDAEICVSNNSQDCIKKYLDSLGVNFRYVHKKNDGPFSRARGINFGVKELVNSEYFLISDIDLIYQKNYIQNVIRYVYDLTVSDSTPLRGVFYNYNLRPIIWPRIFDRRFFQRFGLKYSPGESSEYLLLESLPKIGGFAHGNGLIHLDSFLKIRGYNEEMIGYGPEDDLFNTRISKINRIIYDDRNELASIHLWHPPLRRTNVKQNMEIWELQKKILSQSDSNCPLVVANNCESWGKI